MTDRTKPRCGSTRRTPANPSRPPDRGGLNALARILLHHRSSGRVGPDDRARARRLRIVRRMGRSGRRAAQGRLQDRDPGARPNFCVGRRGDRAVPLRGDAGATPSAGAGSRLGNARDESGEARRREPAAATHRETAVRLLGGARGGRGETGRHGPMVLFAAATGLRPGEWIALEQRDINLSPVDVLTLGGR